jgi:hypothetical protein
MTPKQMANLLRGVINLQAVSDLPELYADISEIATWIDKQSTVSDQYANIEAMISWLTGQVLDGHKQSGEQFTSIEAAIQLLTGTVLNMRTELLIIKTEVQKLTVGYQKMLNVTKDRTIPREETEA